MGYLENTCASVTASLGQALKTDLKEPWVNGSREIVTFFPMHSNTETSLAPLPHHYSLLQGAHLLCCAQLHVLHMGAPRKACCRLLFLLTALGMQRAPMKQSCWRWRASFSYSERMEKSFLVGSSWLSSWLIDCFSAAGFFSSVGGVLGGWEPIYVSSKILFIWKASKHWICLSWL